MKQVLVLLVPLVMGALLSFILVKILRKNLEGQFIYINDPYLTWTLAFWALIFFLSQLIGEVFYLGEEYEAVWRLSPAFFLTFLFVSLNITYRRIIVSPLKMIEKRFYFKDRIFNRNNLIGIYTFLHKGKHYSFHLTNGKKISFYAKNIEINGFYKRFKVYEEYKNQVANLPSPLFDEEVSLYSLKELELLASEEDRIDQSIISQFEETIASDKNLIFYDAQNTLTIIGVLIAMKTPGWAKYNLSKYPKLVLNDESIIYKMAFKALKTIKETENEWLEITRETGYSYYDFELEQMYIISESLSKNLDISTYTYPKKLIFDRLIENLQGYGYTNNNYELILKYVSKAKEAYLSKNNEQIEINIDLAMDQLLLGTINKKIAVELLRIRNS